MVLKPVPNLQWSHIYGAVTKPNARWRVPTVLAVPVLAATPQVYLIRAVLRFLTTAAVQALTTVAAVTAAILAAVDHLTVADLQATGDPNVYEITGWRRRSDAA